MSEYACTAVRYGPDLQGVSEFRLVHWTVRLDNRYTQELAHMRKAANDHESFCPDCGIQGPCHTHDIPF